MSYEFLTTQPLIFEPIFKERVWGGRRLEESLGKKLPPKQIGESWEIVDRPEAQSVVKQGEFRGRTLHELWTQYRAEIFGEGGPDAPRFPILCKLLDARETLSLQVHPPAAVASSRGGEAKTEMWYVLKAASGAEIFAGLRQGVTRADFENALATGNAECCLHRIATQSGDAFFVPSGRLHAIGAGNLIVEIQENSDTTYRVFDWNRRDENGDARALHLEAAMQSIDFQDHEPRLIQPNDELLVRAPRFVVEKWELKRPREALPREEFALFVCLRGALQAGATSLRAGEFFLVPATAAALELRPTAPETSVLRVTLPR